MASIWKEWLFKKGNTGLKKSIIEEPKYHTFASHEILVKFDSCLHTILDVLHVLGVCQINHSEIHSGILCFYQMGVLTPHDIVLCM